MKKHSLILTIAFLAMFTCLNAVADEYLMNNKEFGQKPFPPKAEFAKRPDFKANKMSILEFEERLQLTEAQKEKIKKNHDKSREKMRKIIEQERKLKEQKHAIIEENRKEFEAVLTEEQKEILKKMRSEKMQKLNMMKEEQKGKHHHKGDIKTPQPIKPKTQTK